ncbi:MAG: O-antigen ligase family protein [Clostridia bacterium]|nr:O-antigen ligase family protein [Clostridia bacterium]
MEKENDFKPMKTLTGILDILICLLLFISALYKGGFYKEDSLFVNVVICMLGLVCLSVKLVLNIRDNRKLTKSKLGTIVDICVMLMPISYFLPVIFGKAASVESALFEMLRYVNFTIIYFIVRSSSNKKTYLTAIVLIGIVLATFGIDELTYRGIEKLLNPISINYLSDNNGQLSSTLQYANITALIMLMASIIVQDKISKNLPNLNNNSGVKFKALIIAELFGLILLQSAIILTTSRMNLILMIATTIIYSVYCLRQNKNKSALALILMLVASISLVTSIDSYLLVKNNLMVIFTYVITLILIIIAIVLGTKFIIVKTYDRKDLSNKKRILTKAIYLAIAILVTIIIATTPNELRLNDNIQEGTSITRNIYVDLRDSIKLDVCFEFYRNNNFELHLYQVDSNFNKKILVSLTKDSLKDNEYHSTLNVSENAGSLLLEFKTIDSDVSIEQFKVNDNNVTLSYMFIPDSIMFRLKDTLIKDSNNTLRFTYYQDALKLFNKSKLYGIGGEGFKARYQEVQTESYISSEVHSVPLQVLVESGIVGFASFVAICVGVCIIVYRLFKIKNEETLLYLLMIFSFVITSVFDLVFSFGIMLYIFAVMVGLVIGEYKSNIIPEKDKYELDNKYTLGMLKIATLSISLMALFLVTIYSINIFRASMIVIPNSEETLENSYDRVGLLETKVALDKYNLAYLNSLLIEYDTHIDLLNEIYLSAQSDEEKQLFKEEINSYIIKQKEVADSIVECEYYNKYAIEKVARCYFNRYVSYAHIFDNNFKNDEIAYVFYIGYAIKLTDRLTEIGKVNNLAREFAIDIYEENITILEKQNSLIKSDMMSQAIEDMEEKLEKLK